MLALAAAAVGAQPAPPTFDSWAEAFAADWVRVLKDFHDLVLKTGSVPLDVLADVVQRWVQDQLALAKEGTG